MVFAVRGFPPARPPAMPAPVPCGRHIGMYAPVPCGRHPMRAPCGRAPVRCVSLDVPIRCVSPPGGRASASSLMCLSDVSPVRCVSDACPMRVAFQGRQISAAGTMVLPCPGDAPDVLAGLRKLQRCRPCDAARCDETHLARFNGYCNVAHAHPRAIVTADLDDIEIQFEPGVIRDAEAVG